MSDKRAEYENGIKKKTKLSTELKAEKLKCYARLKELDPIANKVEYEDVIKTLKELKTLDPPKGEKKRIDPNNVIKYICISGTTIGVALLEAPGLLINAKAAKAVSDIIKIF